MLVGGDSDSDNDDFKPQKRAVKEAPPVPLPSAMKDDSDDEEDFKPAKIKKPELPKPVAKKGIGLPPPPSKAK